MEYLIVHQTLVALTFLSFSGRVLLMASNPEGLRYPLVRIAPHIIDTLLLVSGVWLMVDLAIYPWEQGWLAAKLIALLVYIGVAVVAMHRVRAGKSPWAWVLAAYLAFVYMLAVAVTRSPLPGLGG